MTLQELIDDARILLDDLYANAGSPSDLLFSDASLTRYLNRAERKFCELTGHIVKEAPLALTPDVSDYSLPTNTIRVRLVRYNDRIIHHTTMHSWTSSAYFNPSYEQHSGSVSAYRTDVSSAKSIRFIGKPALADTAVIQYQSYPAADMALMTSTPEIPYEWHHVLVPFAVSESVGGVNVDTADTSASTRLYRKFVDECRDAKARLLEAMTPSVNFGFSS